MVDDAEYLFKQMAHVLPGVTASQATAVHAAVAEPARVQVARSDDHGFEAADNAALRRELTRVREQLATSEANYAHTEAAYQDSQTKLAEATRAPRRRLPVAPGQRHRLRSAQSSMPNAPAWRSAV